MFSLAARRSLYLTLQICVSRQQSLDDVAVDIG